MVSAYLIHDCSQPEGKDLNYSYADIEPFKYQSIDNAIKLLGLGFYVGKVDLRHAYCLFTYIQVTMKLLG